MGSVTARLARQTGLPVRTVGGLHLMASADAPAFLDACSAAGVRVLGFEGFRVLEDSVEPEMDVITDLSDLVDPEESIREARAVVESAESDLFFDFTLE